jgi:hypothetical protein
MRTPNGGNATGPDLFAQTELLQQQKKAVLPTAGMKDT